MQLRGSRLQRSLASALARHGFHEENLSYYGSIFTLAGGDLNPVFTPALVRRRGHIQILGGIGLYIREFENWWTVLIDSFIPEEKRTNLILIGLYITNIHCLIDPPEFDEINSKDRRLNEWLLLIKQQMSNFPTDIESMLNRFAVPVVDKFPISRWSSHPVKKIAFKMWLRERGFKLPVELLDDQSPPPRTSPYELIYESLKAQRSIPDA